MDIDIYLFDYLPDSSVCGLMIQALAPSAVEVMAEMQQKYRV